MSKKGHPNRKYTALGAQQTQGGVEIITEQYTFEQRSIVLKVADCRVLSRHPNRLSIKHNANIMRIDGHQATIDKIERIIKGDRS